MSLDRLLRAAQDVRDAKTVGEIRSARAWLTATMEDVDLSNIVGEWRFDGEPEHGQLVLCQFKSTVEVVPKELQPESYLAVETWDARPPQGLYVKQTLLAWAPIQLPRKDTGE